MDRDQALLQQLERLNPISFEGSVTRNHWQTRSPLQGGIGGGRWSLPSGVETLYTALRPQGAICEIGHRLVDWGSPIPTAPLELATIDVVCPKVLDLRRLETLSELGVPATSFSSNDYSASAAVGDAAYYLGCDAILVPSARLAGDTNLVIFMARAEVSAFQVRSSETLTPTDVIQRYQSIRAAA